jgi:hypothetical protein
MWSLVGGPYLAAAGLLVLAGVPKLTDPMPLVRALRTARLPASRGLVRAVAASEVVLGVAAVAVPGRLTAAAVAVSYLTFSAFVALVLRRGGVLGSCGCFGRPDTPPTLAHLAVTLVLAVSAAALAAAPPREAVWSSVGGELIALVGFAALLAWLAYLVMAVLPATTPAAVRSAGPAGATVRRS